MFVTSKCLRNTYRSIAVLLVLMPLPGFAQSKVDEHVYRAADWGKRVGDCYDSCGNVNSNLLNRIVREAEASRAHSIGAPMALELAAPDLVLADAYLQQGRFEDARMLLSQSRFLVAENGRVSFFQPTLEFKMSRAYMLAAIAATQKHYTEASRQYLWCVWFRLRYAAFQPVLLAALVLALWKVRPGGISRFSQAGSRSVIVLSCAPIWMALLGAVVCPLNSLVLFGDVAKSTTDHRCTFIAGCISGLEWMSMLVALAVLVNRCGSLSLQETNRLTTQAHTEPPIEPQSPVYRKSSRFLILVVVGVILAGGQRFVALPIYWYPHHMQFKDVWWWISMFQIVLAGPICEEIYFRGSLYRLARQTMDPQYGAALSAVAFAGYHLEPSRFLALVWAGFILAMLYEIKKNIRLPAAVHMLHNLLSNW